LTWTVGFLDTVRALLAGRFADAEAAVARGREAARDTAAPPALARVRLRQAAVVRPPRSAAEDAEAVTPARALLSDAAATGHPS
jgi:hypothetical protein